jgi:sterol desaturase/sphingolipid hydroxylase (fatty acid hydroxylase superfamily)
MASTMAETIMLYAIPCFFLLIAVELVAARVMGRTVYRLNDALGSLSLGVMSQISGVFTKALSIGIYAVVLEHVSLFELSASSPWVWVVGLVLYDFCYYWLHRAGHEVTLFWAAHVVHHQSERYNLTTALRQTSSGALFGWIFYLPMAVLGFPLEVFAVVAVIDLLYQYWIHTELVGKLGWFDRVFASPSNHRVHHAVNDRYLDKNYGGIFILWDRLFGTFIEERDDDPTVYGTRSPLRSLNPLWANLEVYAGVWRDTWRTSNWSNRIRLWLGKPGWQPADLQATSSKPAFNIHRPEFNPVVSARRRMYVTVNFGLLLLPAVFFLLSAKTLPVWAAALYALGLVLNLVVLGALMEGVRRPVRLEALRLSTSLMVALALVATAYA